MQRSRDNQVPSAFANGSVWIEEYQLWGEGGAGGGKHEVNGGVSRCQIIKGIQSCKLDLS